MRSVVRTQTLLKIEFLKSTGLPTGRQKVYHRVVAGMLGNCGHEHTSLVTAEKCLKKMKVRYRKARWGKK
jgi:hypothetical protein